MKRSHERFFFFSSIFFDQRLIYIFAKWYNNYIYFTSMFLWYEYRWTNDRTHSPWFFRPYGTKIINVTIIVKTCILCVIYYSISHNMFDLSKYIHIIWKEEKSWTQKTKSDMKFQTITISGQRGDMWPEKTHTQKHEYISLTFIYIEKVGCL